MSEFNAKVIQEFRENKGVVGGFFDDKDVLLLETTGAKSGQRRLSPLLYARDDTALVVAASNEGAPKDPDWFRNVLAHQDRISVEVGDLSFLADAQVFTEGAEHDRLFQLLDDRYGIFAGYAAKAGRTIPVVRLEMRALSDVNGFNAKVIREFRENQGVVSGRFATMDLVLLHTTGAKSGQRRINPVASLRDGGAVVVVASFGGAPRHPDWYRNIVAHPDQVRAELPDRTFDAEVEVFTEGAEWDRLYALLLEKFPVLGTYKAKTDRVFPVVSLREKTG
ncbi:nitroreductase family deazaflavin-dependent oxidoreductase [Pseudonocardiaceae bacterium YIM PH 21723]|nr:nitroreductase family deazaflavin-dependent oxidoreductase [Pseudonocardiaceae bacterium YIM PH 21723]